jgi:hypothetical protein
LKVKQITAWVDNRPGEVARIAAALAKAKINISGISCWSAGSESPIHLLVSSPAKARKVFHDLGVRQTEEEVLRVTLADTPGRLAAITERLLAARINIEYAYACMPTAGKKGDLILAVSDVSAAVKALHGMAE